jgi:hypothetical protein
MTPETSPNLYKSRKYSKSEISRLIKLLIQFEQQIHQTKKQDTTLIGIFDKIQYATGLINFDEIEILLRQHSLSLVLIAIPVIKLLGTYNFDTCIHPNSHQPAPFCLMSIIFDTYDTHFINQQTLQLYDFPYIPEVNLVMLKYTGFIKKYPISIDQFRQNTFPQSKN